MHTDNPLPEEPTFYVRVGSGFLVVKLTVGEILRCLVWHQNNHSPFYVKCPKCGRVWVTMVEWWNNRKLFEGKLKANCPHNDQVLFDVRPGENAFFLREDSLRSAFRESYGQKPNDLINRKITEFLHWEECERRNAKP